MKISLTVISCRADMIFILIISKGHKFCKNVDELWFFFYPHDLVKLNICTKFHENLTDSIKVIKRTRFLTKKN